jgi:hypothetical protein
MKIPPASLLLFPFIATLSIIEIVLQIVLKSNVESRSDTGSTWPEYKQDEDSKGQLRYPLYLTPWNLEGSAGDATLAVGASLWWRR